MTKLWTQKSSRPWLITALVCFLLALFFKFALIGYAIMALFFAGAGIVILLYLVLPKKFKIMLTILLCVGAIVFSAALLPVIEAAKGTPDIDADYLIVLGAGVNGTVPSLSMVNRLNAALDYLSAHPDCIAVVSGGQGRGEDVTEAQAMHTWLLARGIAEERIIEEARSTSTEENLRFSLALIPDAENQSIAVCSSEYHLCRATLLAEQMGYTVGGIPAKTTKPVLKLNYFAREALGLSYLRLFGDL